MCIAKMTYDEEVLEDSFAKMKKAKEETEKCRVAIRNIRKDANESIKKLKNDGASEDEIKVGEAEVQKLTDAYIIKIDQLAELKEKDIMTV